VVVKPPVPHRRSVEAIECTINLSQKISIGIRVRRFCLSVDRADHHWLIIEQTLLLLGEAGDKTKVRVAFVSSDPQCVRHESQV